MKKWLWLIVIICLAAAVRLYKINDIPYGYSWDETSINYNAWGISLWYRDEWAEKLPLAFKSFGDYKAPLLFYLLAVPFKLFGPYEGLIRIYSAVAGIGTVIVSYLIAQQVYFKQKKLSYITAIGVALSPWAVNFSRVGFEATIALFLAAMAIWLFLKATHNIRWLSPALFFTALSLYAYHSAKIAMPIFVLGYAVLYRKHLLSHKKQLFASLAVGLLVAAPVIYATVFGRGFERGMTMIIFDNNGKVQNASLIVSEFVNNVLNQFSLPFLVGGMDAVGLRHLTPGSGVLYVVELPLLIGGLILCLKRKDKVSKLILIWLLAGFAPALLAHQTPHAVRSLLALPALYLLIAQAMARLFDMRPKQAGIVLMGIGVFYSINVYSYLNSYYGEYATASAYDFQYGYREALEKASQLGKTKDKIIVTDAYGQPYIYVLWANKIKPQEFLAGALANYEFHAISWPYHKPDSVVVATPEEIPITDPLVVDKVVLPGTDQVVFVIAVTPE